MSGCSLDDISSFGFWGKISCLVDSPTYHFLNRTRISKETISSAYRDWGFSGLCMVEDVFIEEDEATFGIKILNSEERHGNTFTKS